MTRENFGEELNLGMNESRRSTLRRDGVVVGFSIAIDVAADVCVCV